MWYVGIDNGVSGSVALVSANAEPARLFPTPTFTEQNYTKAKGNISRVDHQQFMELLVDLDVLIAVVERPMINPARFKASISAARCLESQLIVLEKLQIPYQYVDSKSWQRAMLPHKTDELKKDSRVMGKRLFPHLSKEIDKQEDADALLMAAWAKRERL